MTSIPLNGLPDDRVYKILSSLVVPRPIALVSSQNAEGIVNAAPYSFFNVVSEAPPLLVIGLAHNADGTVKDTTRNIRDSGEFVVNLVDEDIAAAMNICATDFPPDMSELDAAGLTTASSTVVRPPRIAEAPVALECVRQTALTFGEKREIVIGRILHVHVRDGLMTEGFNVQLDAYRPVGRLFANLYGRISDRFELARGFYKDWQGGR